MIGSHQTALNSSDSRARDVTAAQGDVAVRIQHILTCRHGADTMMLLPRRKRFSQL